MISTHMKSGKLGVTTDRKTFGYLVHDLARLLRRRFDAAAQHYGLTLPQWRVIGRLSLHDGISQVALAGLTDTDPMTVSGLVERLEGKGLVIRVTDPSDSRAKIVKITDKATAMVTEMKRLVRKHGLFCGPSSGAHMLAAQRIRGSFPELRTVVTVFCDEGEKYLHEYFMLPASTEVGATHFA